jgi:hypothetical protein
MIFSPPSSLLRFRCRRRFDISMLAWRDAMPPLRLAQRTFSLCAFHYCRRYFSFRHTPLLIRFIDKMQH